MRGRKARFRLPAGLMALLALPLIAGCGSSGISGTIPADDAQTLQADLSAVQQAFEQGDCPGAAQAAQSFVDAVNQLPVSVGVDLKTALRGGGENLVTMAQDPSKCQPTTGTTGLSGSQPTSSSTSTTSSTTTTSSSTSTSTSSTPPGHEGTPPGHEPKPPKPKPKPKPKPGGNEGGTGGVSGKAEGDA